MELDLNDKALLQKAIARVSAANEVVQFLSDYFRDKYGLTPANAIMPNGQIINQETVVVSNGIGTLQGVTGNTN